MTFAEETLNTVRSYFTMRLNKERYTMYEVENRILRINRSMARTSFEEFIVNEEKGVFIMRVHMGLHCLRSCRTSCLNFMSRLLEKLRAEGFYVELLMDGNGDVYCQKTQYIKTEAASRLTVQTMYLDILKVMVEHDTELQVAMLGLDSNDVFRNLMVEEEKELLVKEARKEMEKEENCSEEKDTEECELTETAFEEGEH